MREHWKYYSFLLAILLSVSFMSCGDDEEDNNNLAIPENQNTNHNTNDDRIEKNIKSCIYTMVSYFNYCYQIDITSTLSGVYPNSVIKYGIECGYGDYKYQKYAVATGKNSYSCVSSIFLDSEEEFADEAMYWRSYMELLEWMEVRNLNEDEQDLYNEIVKTMKSSESKAKSQYQGRVFVEVDNERYYIKTF